MAFDVKKFLDQEGVKALWQLIKNKVSAEETRAKAAEEANAAAAKKAQDDVDALNIRVGVIPAGATATDVIGYVQEKTAGIATEGAMTELGNRVKAIEDDYLVEADKTELEGKITAAQTAANNAQGAIDGHIEAYNTKMAALDQKDADLVKAIENEAKARAEADAGLDERLVEVETFFKTAEGETISDALDTLVEIQKYITDEGAAADQMVKDIAANTKAIEDEAAAREEADQTLQGNINTLSATVDTKASQEALNTLSGVVDTKASQEALNTLEGRVKANEDAIGNDSTATTIKGRIKALEDANHQSGEQVNKAIQDAIAALKLSETYDAKGAAADAEAAAKAYADSLAGNYDAAGSAATAESKAKAYADSLATNYDAAGSAAAAETAAKAHADTQDKAVYDAIVALTVAEVQAAVASIENPTT